jgi:NAD(P)-dependent dehydrogenase (short-subunit alcohol dehydrogenase family)
MPRQNKDNKKVAVIIGATSKWQSDGRNTKLAHGKTLSDEDIPVAARWGIGGAIAQKFAREGYFVVATTRAEANAMPLAKAIDDQGGACMIVELDLVSPQSISSAFATITDEAGEPDIVVYNAGYLEGRELPPGMELLEHIPDQIFETAIAIACRGPFLVAKEVLPRMREKQSGSFFFELLARQEAADRRIPVLSARSHADARPGADRGILRARRAHRQRRHRRHHRFTRNTRPQDRASQSQSPDRSGQDRRSLLLSPHPASLVLDA